MAQVVKHKVLNAQGIEVRMNDAALKIAEKHFGINPPRVIKQIPPELRDLPRRIEVIKGVPRFVDEKPQEPIKPEIKEPEAPEVKAPEIKTTEAKVPEAKTPIVKKVPVRKPK